MNKYAVLIGVNRYHESLGNLKYAGADCRRLKNVLLSGNLGFDEERMLLHLAEQLAGPAYERICDVD